MGYSADSMGTLGILGGGQLSRMTALAARQLGFRVHALDPVASCAVSSLVDRLIVAPYSDEIAARELASACDVVTLDLEHVPASLLRSLADLTKVRPGAGTLHIIQDRGRQKEWLRDHGFPVGPFRVAEGAEALGQALIELEGTCYVKAAHGGFDGRGQAKALAQADPRAVLSEVGAERVTVERGLLLKAELSVLVARRPSGESVAYPAALNHHEGGILAYSLLPAPLPEPTLARAREIALEVTRALDTAGVCAVEMFLLYDDTLLINELAPRPHNSYHGSDRAFETGQFEQHVRAVFDLPLGPVGVVRPTAMANLLGDVWLGAAPPSFERALEIPSVRAQLYGKGTARPGRKLGHLTAIGHDMDQALERVQRAQHALAHPDRGPTAVDVSGPCSSSSATKP